MKLYSVKIDRIIQLYGWKRRLKERYPLAMNCVIFSKTDRVCRPINIYWAIGFGTNFQR